MTHSGWPVKKASRCLTVMVAAALLLSGGCSDPGKEACDRVTSVAEDPGKVEYLKEWIEERTSEPEFLVHMGKLGLSNAPDDPRHFEQLRLDTELLGIDQRYAFVWLHGDVGRGDDLFERSTIKYVEIGEGRSSLIVLVGEGVDGIEGIDRVRDNLRIVSEDVVVLCR